MLLIALWCFFKAPTNSGIDYDKMLFLNICPVFLPLLFILVPLWRQMLSIVTLPYLLLSIVVSEAQGQQGDARKKKKLIFCVPVCTQNLCCPLVFIHLSWCFNL